jgi:MoaA/NifB/PqqE/SkfB family radical SAM enzyme
MILLAGGEPLLREDVLTEAAVSRDILFPVFSNGTMLKGENLSLFDAHRNLIPMLSIEGDEAQTDARREAGIYAQLMEVFGELSRRGILFGVSITVTTENIKTVTADTFVEDLYRRGCRIIIYVEYIPVEKPELAPGAVEQEFLQLRLGNLRKQRRSMIFISFPGDEKESQGCLAAGRGFFHINSRGGAEPCPFSPYSDTNLRGCSLSDALNSPLFRKLRDSKLLQEQAAGGCHLFQQEAAVREFAEGTL